jgi:hypothetical protein
MNYVKISDDAHKQHLMALIDFIYQDVIAEGGDGDTLWYSKHYDIRDIKSLIKEFNSKLQFPWEIKDDGKTLQWGENQEWVLI